MKYVLICLLAFFGFNVHSQDTIAVQSIERAIEETNKGNFVSLGLMSDANSEFPSDFFRIPNDQLIGLVIDNCSYEIIPEAIKNYKNLVYFRYSWFYYTDSPLKRFPDFIPETSSLQVVIIERANLKVVPSIEKLTDLKELSLYQCNLIEFPQEVLKLRKLERLNLACNTFTSVPDNINQLTELRSLHFEGGACGGTPIASIPETIGDLTLLEEFSIGYNDSPIKTLPRSFYTLENLTYFQCNGCGLESLSDDLGKLKNLETLQLTNLSYFTAFPETLFTLPKLTSFRFYLYGEADKSLKDQQTKMNKWGDSLESYYFEMNLKNQ